MAIDFENPDVFLLLPLLLLLAAPPRFLGRGNLFSSLRLRKVLATTSLIGVLVLVLARPVLRLEEDRLRVSALVDISESMDRAVGASLLGEARKLLKPDQEIEVIPFAGQAGVPLPSLPDYRELQEGWGKLNVGATDLLSAFDALVQGRKHALLISDGFATTGTEEAILSYATSRGVVIFPLIPKGNPIQERQLRLTHLHAPLVASAEESVEIRASVSNSTAEKQRGTIVVKHEDKVLLEREIEIAPSSEALITVPSDPSKEGIRKVTAEFRPRDDSFPPSSQIIYLSGETREKVLLLSGSPEDERVLKGLLSGQGFRLDAVVTTGISSLPKDFSTYSSIILNNVPYAHLERVRAQELVDWVKQGGGLIMTGGNRSFGLGGYLNTIIEDVLPVRLVPPRTTQKRLNVALALVIDKSRSMAERQRLDYAKEAAKGVVDTLKDDDLLSVIGFDRTPFVVIKLTPLAEIRDKAKERIDRLFSAGKTDLLPAMDEARRALTSAAAGRKHMLVLTDGRVPDAGPYYLELTRQLKATGITVSTVLLDSLENDQMLEAMAQAGGGNYYQVTDVRSLPRVFLQDVKVNTGEKTMQESQDFPVELGPSGVKTTAIASFPSLKGFVEVKQRDGADLELLVDGSEGKFPLLASWAVGKGKVVAYSSDTNGRWSASWVRWPRFSQFWNDVLSAVLPQDKAGTNAPKFDLRYYVENGELLFDLAVFAPIDGGVTADVIGPDGETHQLVFASPVPGRYTSTLPGAVAGKHEVRIRGGQTPFPPVAFHLSGELFGEKKGQGFNTAFLTRLAKATGGKVNPTPKDLSEGAEKGGRAYDLSSYLFVLAALILGYQIYLRELAKGKR